MPAPGPAAASPFDAPPRGAPPAGASPFDAPPHGAPFGASPFDAGFRGPGGPGGPGGRRDASPGPWRPPGAREPSPGPWRPPAAPGISPGAGPWQPPAPAPAPAPPGPAGGARAGGAPGVHTDRARYFVITSNTKENVVRSVRHGLWATQRKNEQRLDEAFRASPAVLLIFSVNHSDCFQGYALMRSPIGRPRSGVRDPFHGFGRLFDVEWLRLHDLPYKEIEHIRNPLNGDRPVQSSRDGQELSNDAGRRLCGLIDRHIDDPDSFPKKEAQRSPGGPPPPPPTHSLEAGPPAIPPPMALEGRSGGRSRSRSRGRRRKREKKNRKAPHPLEATFEEQLEYFLGCDYDDYVEWFGRFAAFSPGPTPPPGCPAPKPGRPPLQAAPAPAPGGSPGGPGGMAPPPGQLHGGPGLPHAAHGLPPPHGYPPHGAPPPGHFPAHPGLVPHHLGPPPVHLGHHHPYARPLY